jgi:acetyl/propionyl-CoA carboxylase alpha subunit
VRIGPASAIESYLSIEAVLDAARKVRAEAIHPGYGFLAENPRFANACAEAGLIFIGPPAEVIERVGSKIAARAIAKAAGVPTVPGETPADQSDASIAASAMNVGLPVVIKPSAGGGGIGMKEVREERLLLAAIGQARREAEAAFGNGALYVERLVNRPRHLEIQVLGDQDGNVVHLFERECSIQRRHQKIIEESPSPALTPRLRKRMGQAAVAVARAAAYRNAGTVEFLLEGTGEDARFYFLEMNTRLQVEHPVTEQVVGVDLVRAQIAVAGGAPVPWAQDALTQRGHAIEARVYAEDPTREHLPQAGPLLLYREPSMPGIRIDAGVAEGGEVSVHYDPLIAKLIAWGETRKVARRRAIAALRSYPILGVRTNIPLLIELLEHQRFVDGDLDTGFLDIEGGGLRSRLIGDIPPEALAVAAAARQAMELGQQGSAAGYQGSGIKLRQSDPWSTLRHYRG